MEQNNDSLKKEVEELMRLKGRTKGSELLTFASYIRDTHGEEGLKAVEKKMAGLGHPFHFDQVKETGEWYPENINVLAILVAKHVFNWSKKDVFDFGYNSPKYSFLLKVFLKYFSSPEITFAGTPRYWRKFLDVGELEATELNMEKKYFIIRLKDYNFHPVMCDYFAGYLLRLAENSLKSPKIKAEETQCSYQGGPYHEYKVSWE
jgi:hypothetical protein